MKIEESCIARRRFLCGMIGGGAAALGAGVIGPLVEYAGDFHPAPPPLFITLEKDVLGFSAGKIEDGALWAHSRAAAAAAGGGRARCGFSPPPAPT